MNYDSKDPSRRSNNYWLASSRLLLIASMIGIGTGLASIAFKVLIEIINGLFFIRSGYQISVREYYLILLPALGGLLAGSIAYLGAGKGGYGASEVMAVVDQDGMRKAGPVWAKTFASAVTMVQWLSRATWAHCTYRFNIGSVVGQKFQVSPDILRTLLACGAAGGISATFNAPIGGVLFAQEVILGRFSSSNFILIVISSLISAIISRVYWGDYPSFMVPPYELITPGELLFYLVLGVLAGTLAVIFIKALYSAEDLFKQIPFPTILNRLWEAYWSA